MRVILEVHGAHDQSIWQVQALMIQYYLWFRTQDIEGRSACSANYISSRRTGSERGGVIEP